tara:strand:+ start:326 stop:1468 length:1143 start_codon:yes stop_codon:yes gene_type:complete
LLKNIFKMKKKIKLVFFHPYSYLGGADNSLFRLISNLNLDQFSITFISLNNSYLKNILDRRISFERIKVSRTIFSMIKFRKLIQSYNVNKKYEKVIIISNQNFANIITFFTTFNIKGIKTILVDRNHIDELNFYNNYKEKLKKILIKFLIKFTYPKADLIIGISTKLSRDLSVLTKTKVKTVYSPSFDKSIIKKAKQNIILSNQYKYIINVSRFSKRKDHETTLKAFQIVSNKIQKVKLILIGYGPEYKKIISMAKDLNIYNKMIIINKTYNPYSYIKRSKILISTSVYEGFPNVLVESLTIGTPVISTNMNAGASEILLNGKGGELIKIGDYNNLSKKIIFFLNSPKKLLDKTRFAQKNLNRFNNKIHAKIYSKIFKEI